MSTTQRFSKTSFRDDLIRRRDALQSTHKFDRNNGWAQVQKSPIERIVAYGRYAQLNDLISELN